MVDLDPLDEGDLETLREMLTNHVNETGSPVAAALLEQLGPLHQGDAARLQAGPRRDGGRQRRPRVHDHGWERLTWPTPQAFSSCPRQDADRRPVDVRILDWKEVYADFPAELPSTQGARCMDCGIPFCHNGCPLGNIIPEWNDLVYRDVARGPRAAAQDQQLPGVHRPRLPRAVRGGLRARRSTRAGHHQADRVESSTAASTKAGSCPSRPTAPARRSPSSAPARPGLAAAEQLNRAGHRHRLRACRPHRRPADLRHPRVQAGEARRRPPRGADGSRRNRVPHRATSAST